MRIPTPIPSSVARWLMNLLSGGVVDVLWFIVVTSFIVGLAYLLVSASPIVGGAIAGILLSTLVNDNVRAFVRDVYARNFWSASV